MEIISRLDSIGNKVIIMAYWLREIFRTLMSSAKGSVKSGLSLVYVIFILISIHFLVLFKLSHSRSDMSRDEYYCERGAGNDRTTTIRDSRWMGSLEIQVGFEVTIHKSLEIQVASGNDGRWYRRRQIIQTIWKRMTLRMTTTRDERKTNNRS